MKPYQLVLPLALLLAQCRKHGPDPVKPEDQLPVATQTGANTFGCLVNGRPWLPSGNDGTPNSVALYDPGINTPGGANLNISTYQIAGNDLTYILLSCGPITPQKRVFVMNLATKEAIACYQGPTDRFCGGTLTYLKGQIALTRVDETAGVVAGTFWFTALRQGSSDTLKVTQGRFDYKF